MKNKTVKLMIGIVVLGVLCGTYGGVKVYVEKQEAKEEQENEEETVAICDIEKDDLASITYTVDDEEITLTKSDDSWVKDGDEDFPLDQSSIDTAVDDLLGLEADRQIDDVEDFSEYDLDSPQNQITLTTTDGEKTVLYVGMKYESGNQYFIEKEDDDSTVYLVGTSAVSPFMTTLYDMAEAETFPAITSSNINKIEVDKEDSYTLTKDNSTLKWIIQDKNHSEDADSSTVSDLTSAAGSLAYDQFVDYNCTDDSEYGLDDPYATITIDYTEEEEVEAEDDSEDTDEESTTDSDDDSEETEDADEAEDTEDGEESTSDSENTDDDSDEATEDEEESETITVNKTVKIFVGDEAEASDDSDAGRYVKIECSDQVYTMTDDTLSTFLDKTSEDFYSLSVSSIAYSTIDSLDIDADNESHTIQITSEVTEEETDSDDEDDDSDSEDSSTTTTTTTYTYSLDGEDVDSSDFSTFYNKLVNMSAQERLTEEYKPENDASYVFTFNESDGTKVVVSYYEYDSSFYAAVVDDKVYLVNKMDVRDMAEAYQSLLESVTEEDDVDSEEETEDVSDETTTEDSNSEDNATDDSAADESAEEAATDDAE